jgi:predicted Rossmann fold nucleotide-binding protein DprA/Smf involved in DNA uptake
MSLSQQSQAILLLTVSFGSNDLNSAKPLSKGEWSRFAIWLKDHGMEPSNLMEGNLQSQLSGFLDKSISVERIQTLLDRGATLGLALEKWERSGLWVMTRSDAEYPERLKRRLRLDSPPVLFGCGNKSLLNKGGVAVVGSRDANEDDLKFTQNIGKETAFQGHSIVSGGARGVDQNAMIGALDNEGTAIGVMADNLLKAASSAKYRKKIMSGDLVLITPFNPESGFNVGNAMARNRYIYCLSDMAIVISSTTDKGGTWNGAIENLKASWVPLWVKKTENPKSGNHVLVSKGASWLTENPIDIKRLAEVVDNENMSATCSPNLEKSNRHIPKAPTTAPPQTAAVPSLKEKIDTPPFAETFETLKTADIDFFQLYVCKIEELTAKTPLKSDEIASRLKLERAQANAWLKRAVEEGLVERLERPVRYQVTTKSRKQFSLF